MTNTSPLFQKEEQYFFRTYKRLGLDIVKGEGATLTARDGKRYTDFFGGLAVNALGYNHPRINDAIIRQVQKYTHLSNYYVQEPQVALAERLITATRFKRVFFSNSGTEAIEGAIKLARKWGQRESKTQMVGLTNSFHGRTMGALSLTERPKYREGYEPFLPNISHVGFNDVTQLRIAVNDQTLAVVLEFIQGEGGINVVSEVFAAALKELRGRFGFLIIGDEIQSGMGRTGKFFGFEHFDIQPDIVVIAKAIGGGLPLGAFLGNERVADVLSYGAHGTTFGGNPVACAAGVAVMSEILDNGMMQRAARVGEILKNGFITLQKEFPSLVREVRGYGCMLGIDLTVDGQPFVDKLEDRGFLVNCTHQTVLRFLPPYIVTDAECNALLANLKEVFAEANLR